MGPSTDQAGDFFDHLTALPVEYGLDPDGRFVCAGWVATLPPLDDASACRLDGYAIEAAFRFVAVAGDPVVVELVTDPAVYPYNECELATSQLDDASSVVSRVLPGISRAPEGSGADDALASSPCTDARLSIDLSGVRHTQVETLHRFVAVDARGHVDLLWGDVRLGTWPVSRNSGTCSVDHHVDLEIICRDDQAVVTASPWRVGPCCDEMATCYTEQPHGAPGCSGRERFFVDLATGAVTLIEIPSPLDEDEVTDPRQGNDAD